MLNELDSFYLKQEEPMQSCLLAVKTLILKHHPDITHILKYKLPFFCYKGKMLCYIWFHKKYKKPYLGFYNGFLMDDEELLIEKRSRIKIFMFDEHEDLPVQKINQILTQALYIYDDKLTN